MSPDPVSLVRSLYDAYARRDLSTVTSIVAPDVRIAQTKELPWGGVFEGHAGLQRFTGLLVATIDSRVTIEQVFRAGDQVIVTGRTAGTVRANGAAFDVAVAHVFTLRDGKIAAVEYYIDTPAMRRALDA